MTAEFVVALPAVLAVIALAIGAVSVGSASVRLHDVAAGYARALARGDDALAARVAASYPGASFASDVGELVCVTASAAHPLAGFSIDLSARSCALGGGK